MKHLHHIVPIHAGGTDDPSNLVELTIEEHAAAHLKLWEEHGRWQDFFAWKGLTGQIGKDDAIIELIREAIRHRDNSYLSKPKSPETISKLSAALKGKKKSPEHVAKLRQLYATKEWKASCLTAKKFIIDGELVVGLKVWADSHGYPYNSVKTRVCKSGKYKGHKIQVAS